MSAIFGTDGIRGRVPGELNASLAFRFGFALGTWLRERAETRPQIAVGRDPRYSSDMLEAAVIAGACAAGTDVKRLDVIPTPAVSWYTRRHALQAGIMISASHNSFEYNGIKCFTAEGGKLTQEQERELQERIQQEPCEETVPHAVGQVLPAMCSPVREYTDYLSDCVRADISSVRVLFDCANGAASATVPRLIRCLDLNADLIFSAPDGKNINRDCGSTRPEYLGQAVRQGGYDIGFAFDGDADRCIAVDEAGTVMDGDVLLLAIAEHWKRQGRLPNAAITTTVMANMGLQERAHACGIAVHTSEVGDSRVMQKMKGTGCLLGGEPSGHLIFSDYSMTGDGQLTAMLLLEAMAQEGCAASVLRTRLVPWPQVLQNVPVPKAKKQSLLHRSSVEKAVEQAKGFLGEGRILLRPSGTEDMIRILAEGREANKVAMAIELLTDTIRKA
ncbi:MAG: phosphoglucosamine mutase [Eubacteriales bacterium]|nr:phosphoglucosamine mutase [Eubacteriales bacterium]